MIYVKFVCWLDRHFSSREREVKTYAEIIKYAAELYESILDEYKYRETKDVKRMACNLS